MPLRQALLKCRDQFVFYEKEHCKKAERLMANGGYREAALSLEKAHTNGWFAEMANEALGADEKNESVEAAGDVE